MCQELLTALEYERQIIPVRFDDADIPSSSVLPRGAAEVANITAVPVAYGYWQATIDAFVPELLQLNRRFRDYAERLRRGGALLPGEAVLLEQMTNPLDRAQYLFQAKESALRSSGALSDAEQMRLDDLLWLDRANLVQGYSERAIAAGIITPIEDAEREQIYEEMRRLHFR
jgi:hypothetical protein